MMCSGCDAEARGWTFQIDTASRHTPYSVQRDTLYCTFQLKIENQPLRHIRLTTMSQVLSEFEFL
jgi:hypothetical protein